MKIQIIIEPTFSKQWPKLRLRLNDTDWFNDFCKPNEGKHFVLTMYPEEINLKHSNTIAIKHYDKSGDDTIVDEEGNIEKDRAIILKSISFNCKNLLKSSMIFLFISIGNSIFGYFDRYLIANSKNTLCLFKAFI